MSRPSLRAAIDAMCKSCIYDPRSGNGSWREQVRACSSANCPLHPLRPISRPTNGRSRAAADQIGQTLVPALRGSQNGLNGPSLGMSEGGAG